MKTKLVLLLVVLSMASTAQYNSENLSIRSTSEENLSFKNLRLFPVYGNQYFLDFFRDLGEYLPLSQAIDEKKVAITEAVSSAPTNANENQTQNQQNLRSGEQVNTLFIENTSQDTVLILAGEVIKGGKQDRMIAQNILLPPNSGRMNLSVFCVEQGRWNYENIESLQSVSFSTEKQFSSNRLRKVAIVEADQQEVWSEVQEVTRKNQAETKSRTYTALTESDQFQQELNEYLEHFMNVLTNQPGLIGVVACSGDKILGCDLFATPAMLYSQLPNLLQSYSTEAITNGAAPVVSSEMVQQYLNNFLNDESSQEEIVNKNGTILKNNGKKLIISKF